MTTENNTITTDFRLNELCKQYAQDILGDAKSYDPENWLEYVKENANDLVHEWADGCYHVIYYYQAMQICAHCNTDQGADFVRDTGQYYTDINDLAVATAYGEIYSRTLFHLQREIEFLEDLAQAEEV